MQLLLIWDFVDGAVLPFLHIAKGPPNNGVSWMHCLYLLCALYNSWAMLSYIPQLWNKVSHKAYKRWRKNWSMQTNNHLIIGICTTLIETLNICQACRPLLTRCKTCDRCMTPLLLALNYLQITWNLLLNIDDQIKTNFLPCVTHNNLFSFCSVICSPPRRPWIWFNQSPHLPCQETCSSFDAFSWVGKSCDENYNFTQMK